VRFRRAGKVYFFDAQDIPDLAVGDRVIVDTARGLEVGWVVIDPSQVVGAEPGELKRVVRRATWDDLTRLAELQTTESTALDRARTRISEHGLPMRAVLAEYNFDGSQLTICFVSEERRVDFRALVRDLARAFNTRVHLRQIGPRDQAKLLGGIDRCGRELCCSTWLVDFQPISVRMAKNQGLPLNPSEISGVCGKLLCCLAFEDDQYVDMRKGLPKVGAKLTSAVGKGRVIDVNLLTRRITIEWETGTRVEVSADEFAEQQERLARAGAAPGELPTARVPDDATVGNEAGAADDETGAQAVGERQ
jgi:cell fate regulator YaaT (PSP1 superfamily)